MKHLTAKLALTVGLLLTSLSLSGCWDGHPGTWGGHHSRDGGHRDMRN